MDILFLGGVFSPEEHSEIIRNSKSMAQFAANTLQWNFISGLEECNNGPIDIISSLFVGSYPRFYRDAIIRRRIWSHRIGSHDINIGFINIFIIKHILKCISLTIELYKWMKIHQQKNRVLVIYSLHTPFIISATIIKHIYPDMHICVIAPDLPEYMNLSRRGIIYDILKFLDRSILMKLLTFADSFVIITKYMTDPMRIGNKPKIVIEGMIDPMEIDNNQIKLPKDINQEKIILYTGSLNIKYGILELLNAFSLIKSSEYRLWICGTGDADVQISEACNHDKRITWFGQLPRSRVLNLQHNATVLINPRSADDEYTYYSFPSKILEYMASATPVIMNRLPGIPDEYYNYSIVLENGTPQCIADTIISACSKPYAELMQLGINARNFVRNDKNYTTQCSKVYDMIMEAIKVKVN